MEWAVCASFVVTATIRCSIVRRKNVVSKTLLTFRYTHACNINIGTETYPHRNSTFTWMKILCVCFALSMAVGFSGGSSGSGSHCFLAVSNIHCSMNEKKKHFQRPASLSAPASVWLCFDVWFRFQLINLYVSNIHARAHAKTMHPIQPFGELHISSVQLK